MKPPRVFFIQLLWTTSLVDLTPQISSAEPPELELKWGTAASNDEHHLYLHWQGISGKHYQIQRALGEDYPGVEGAFLWENVGSIIAAVGAPMTRQLVTIFPDSSNPNPLNPGPGVPALFVMVQNLSGGGVLVSWQGAAQVVSGQVQPWGSPLILAPASGWDVFAVTGPLVQPEPGVDLQTTLNGAQTAQWTAIQAVLPDIFAGTASTVTGTLDLPGDAGPPFPSGVAVPSRFWRLVETWPDSDGDGLYDWEELNGTPLIASWRSNPNLADSDGDGLADFDENRFSLNAQVAESITATSLQTLTYDDEGRLISLSGAGLSAAYAHDPEGNLETISRP
ncbi:MAG: hypothetical protein KDK99_06285 [Verrucomicrobiales bacterium]|nr:hypothetical protein [Verrucomicrobiales bacterium]